MPEKKQKPISLRYSWYALFVMVMINTSNYVDRLSIGPAMEHLKRYFSASDTQLGWILGAFTFVYAIISLPMGFASDRGKRTFFVGLGALVWSISATTSGFCKSFIGFFAARAAVGAGEGIYAPSGTALIADYFPRNKRATAISIFMSAMLIGGALAIIVAGVILKKTDKFDLERMAKLTPYSQGEQIGDCVYNGLHQTKDRLVSYDFDCGGKPLSVVLSNIDKKHEADARTMLFNVDYRAGEGEPEDSLLEFAASFTETVRDREDDDLQLVTADLKGLPAHFKLPPQYADKLAFDEKAGLLAYKGIMSKDDLQALREISDMPEYQKAVISISNESKFYFRRSDNWKWIFWILGPPGLIFALMAFMLREPVKGGTEDYLTESQAAAINAKGKIDYSPLWKTPSLVIMVFSNVIFTAAIGGLNMWLFPFVERYKGMESSEAAMKIGPIVVVAMLVGVVLSGIVSDMMFKKNKRAYNWIIFVCILAGIPFIYVFIMSDNYLAIVGAIAVGMFLLSWVNGPQNTLLVSVVDPKLRATMNAIHILLIHVLGDGPSPIIIGYLSDQYSLKFAFMWLPVAMLVGAVGFMIAGIFVPNDLKKLEQRMTGQA